MEKKKEFYKYLSHEKIKINWNKKPVEMKLFLSFLSISVVRSKDNLGSSNGWTLLENKELNLIIGGGFVNGIELLDTLQFGTKLGNPYNNYVNPFYIFSILNNEGKLFFFEYYQSEIEQLTKQHEDRIHNLKSSLAETKKELQEMILEVKRMQGLEIELI